MGSVKNDIGLIKMWFDLLRDWVRKVFKILDTFIFFSSPLMIIMFIFSVIVLIERGVDHYRFVRNMQERSLETMAVIVSADYQVYDSIQVKYVDQSGEERYGAFDIKYYPEKLYRNLIKNQKIKIRYLPEAHEYKVVLSEGYADVRRYIGFARDPAILLGISWILIILHPEFLYLAYVEEWDKVMRRPVIG